MRLIIEEHNNFPIAPSGAIGLTFKNMNKAISISLAKIDYDLGHPYIKIIADTNCFKSLLYYR